MILLRAFFGEYSPKSTVWLTLHEIRQNLHARGINISIEDILPVLNAGRRLNLVIVENDKYSLGEAMTLEFESFPYAMSFFNKA